MQLQILLTNFIYFQGRELADGANPFLVFTIEDTFASTAMHLLLPAMGIVPEIPLIFY